MAWGLRQCAAPVIFVSSLCPVGLSARLAAPIADALKVESSMDSTFYISGCGMAINIKDPETDRRARELAERTGESLTTAVSTAISERLERLRGRRSAPDLAAELDAIAERSGALPVLDRRTADQILDYDEHGIPT